MAEPLYQQIARTLMVEIVDGTIHQRLPSETALGRRFQVSHGTVRAALRVLHEEGLTEAEQGRGVFVRAARTRARVCGGCVGLGSHRRHCRKSPAYNRFLELADQAEDLGDQIGSNVPGAANACYRAAGLLREHARPGPRRTDGDLGDA